MDGLAILRGRDGGRGWARADEASQAASGCAQRVRLRSRRSFAAGRCGTAATHEIAPAGCGTAATYEIVPAGCRAADSGPALPPIMHKSASRN